VAVRDGSNPKQWAETAIFVTVDEGGGFYDSGFIEPVDRDRPTHSDDRTARPRTVPYLVSAQVLANQCVQEKADMFSRR